MLTPQPTKDVVAKITKRLFNVEPSIDHRNGERIIVYNGLVVIKDTNSSQVLLPPYCNYSRQAHYRFQFECPLNYTVNGNQLKCTISFTDTTTIINLSKQVIKLDYSLPVNQRVIDGIILTLQTIRLCNGVSADSKLPKTFNVETVSSLQDSNLGRKVGRSEKCKHILPFLGKTETCTTCGDSFNQFRKRSMSPTSSNNGNPESCDEPLRKRALSDITTKLNCVTGNNNLPSQCDHSTDESDQTIHLSPDSHIDMEDIMKNILKDGSAGEFKLLLESQIRNNKSDLDARQRRWDPKVISICLGILLRSPQAYQTLKDSELLTLPSRRTLQYYKNVVKQKPGFSSENLNWMKEQANSQDLSQFGYHGGLLVDEMTIQDDLVITKHGDSWNIVGVIDMGHVNNNIKIITGGKKKVQMATHALQYVFHGLTGFR